MSPFTASQHPNVRNFIVILVDYDGSDTIFGPYTRAAAERAHDRIRRWIDKQEREDGDTQLAVTSYPIHQWGKEDETQ